MPRRLDVKSEALGAADAHERRRSFLGEAAITAQLVAAKRGRHGVRDHLINLMMYRHGLRVSDAIGLRRDDVDLAQARLWITRLKNDLSVEQPIPGDELRAIGRWLALREDRLPWLFVSERAQPLTRQAVNYIVTIAAERAGLGHVYPHMLRHSCGLPWRTAATISGSSRITSAIGIHATPPIIPALPQPASTDFGTDDRRCP